MAEPDPFETALPGLGDVPWNLNPAIDEVRARFSSYSKTNALMYSVEDYGASGTNTDDTEAFVRATAAMKNIPNNGKAILYVPPGQSNINPARIAEIFPPGKSIVLAGAGRNVSEVRPIGGASGSLLVFPGAYSGIRDITVDGRMALSSVSGLTELVVANGPNFSVFNVQLKNSPGDALVLGKGGSAIGAQVDQLKIQAARGYGVRIYNDFVSTDTIWGNVGIGQTGKSGFRTDAAAQNIGLVHVWGAGLLDPSDNHGFWIRNRRQIFAGAQSERNLGRGFFFDASLDPSGFGHHKGHIVAYNNVLTGVWLEGEKSHLMVSTERNGLGNPGNNLATYAGMVMSNTTHNAIYLHAFDNNTTVPADDMPSGMTPSGATAYPFPGRTVAARTQTLGVAEVGASNVNNVSGVSRGEDHRSNSGASFVGGQTLASGLSLGQNSNGAVPSIAAGSPFTIPPAAEVVEVTGTAVINNIIAGRVGRTVRLIFTDAAPGGIAAGVTGAFLRSAFNPGQRGAITLSAGPNGVWYETARSV